MVDNGKSPEGETSPGSENMEGGQGANQSGGSIAEPDLGQNRPTQPDPFRTVVGTGTGTDPRAVSSSVQERLENVSAAPFTPRAWKHQSLHPLDQITSEMNNGLLQILTGLLLCKRSFVSSKGVRFDILNHGLKTD